MSDPEIIHGTTSVFDSGVVCDESEPFEIVDLPEDCWFVTFPAVA